MAASTNQQRILGVLRDRPGLDDDELSLVAGVRPRQQVNQICRRLEAHGIIRRKIGPRGKVVNFLHGKIETGHRSVPDRQAIAAEAPIRSHARRALKERYSGGRVQFDPETTLFVIPCSGYKRQRQGVRISGPSILDQLPLPLRQRFAEARKHIGARTHIDETSLLPAWQRYEGSLYQASRDAIGAALEAGAHVIIVSGGYGLVLAGEPIGHYEAVFKTTWWPGGLLGEILIAYLHRHKLRSVCAVASATTAYARLLRRVNWQLAELESAALLSPEETTGAMVKSPRAQGEALAALFRGGLDTNWTSSDGLSLKCTSLI